VTEELISTPDPQPEPETVTPASDTTTAEPGVSGAPLTAATAPARELPTMEAPGRYTGRFALVYVGLGVVLAAALTGLVVLVIKPGFHPSPSWSTFKPAGGSQTKIISSIANHVASTYKLGTTGGQLVAVIPGKPEVTSGTSNIAINIVAVRRVPQSNTGIATYATNKMEQYTLCGLGAHCSIGTGEPSSERGRLVRREALELALYTFKFDPSVDSVEAFLPPPPGSTTTDILYLRKDEVKAELSQPLSKTLPLVNPPLPSSADSVEAKTIDKLTEPYLYTYQLVALQTGGAALILDPAD
jgi:hypothetical protein